MKELRPELVATNQDVPCTVEGHPMIIEARDAAEIGPRSSREAAEM